MHAFAVTENVLREEIGFPEGDLYEGCSLDFANRLWLSKSFGKKFLPEGPAKQLADSACLELFKMNNSRCAAFRLEPRTPDEQLVIETVKGLFNDLVYQGPELFIDRGEISSRFMTGPGASQKALSFDFYSKLFAGPMTCTSDLLYRVYLDCLKAYPRWLEGEILRNQTFGTQQVVGNRLSYAPKTSAISRSICTEPNLNMLFQKGIGSCIENGLQRVFKIDLSQQPEVNRMLARIGSLHGTFGTIDLSSASDSMSLNVLTSLVPFDLLKWILLTRSPTVTYPDGSCSELHMVSSMGNGFTFPLQTYLFASIVIAAYRTLGLKPVYGGSRTNFGVFGDDIIVLRDSYDFVLRCLELFGFTVNDDKSFNKGSFRESCGGDFFRGHEIRGVYVKKLANDADVYSAINRLVRWSSRSGVLVPKTIAHLRGLLKGKTFFIPWKDGDAEGIKVPNPPKDALVDKHTGAVIYHALTVKSRSFAAPDSSEVSRYYPFKNGKKTKVFFNPDGLLVSHLAGFIRCGRIGVRNDSNTFKIRKRVTSSWSGTTYPVGAPDLLSFLNSLDQGRVRASKFGIQSPLTVGVYLSPGDDWIVVSEMYFS